MYLEVHGFKAQKPLSSVISKASHYLIWLMGLALISTTKLVSLASVSHGQWAGPSSGKAKIGKLGALPVGCKLAKLAEL